MGAFHENLPDGLVVLVPGAGPEQAQQARARRRVTQSLFAHAVRQNLSGLPMRRAEGYTTSPQVFPTRPNLPALVNVTGNTIAGETPHAPGPIPAVAWDGEPGATQPVAV